MKNKKKTIAIIAIVAVIIAIIAAVIFFVFGAEKEPSLQEIIENRTNSYETDFLDSTAQMDDQASVRKYLVNWAENKGIDVKVDKNDNVVYSFKASEGLENRKPTVILCGYDYSCIESYSNSIVCALTLAKNDNPHGEFKIIFVSEENGNKDSVTKLAESHFKDAGEVFYLGNDTASKLADKTAGLVEYEFSGTIYKSAPSYNKAYKITISGLPSQAISSKAASAPNPIKTLGNLLANFKSKSVLFDLVEFTGGNGTSVTPGEASITIVVSEDASTKVEERLDSAIESFNDKYKDNYPEATYTYEAVDMPRTVISSNTTESLISLLYTAPNGTYNKDDDDNVTAFSCITSINVTSGRSVINVVACGYEEATLTELTDAYQTICALTDMTFIETKSYPIYKMSDDSSALAENFKESYLEYKSNTLDIESMAQYTMCSLLAEKYPELKIVPIGVTSKTKDNFAGGFVVHLGKLQ